MKKELLQSIKIIALSLFVGLGVSMVYAWTGPAGTAPNNNTPAPINVGTGGQTKAGSLTLQKIGNWRAGQLSEGQSRFIGSAGMTAIAGGQQFLNGGVVIGYPNPNAKDSGLQVFKFSKWYGNAYDSLEKKPVCSNEFGEVVLCGADALTAITVSLNASQSNIIIGGTTNLSWSSTNTVQCEPISGPGFVTNGLVNGSDTSEWLSGPTKFTIGCYDANENWRFASVDVTAFAIPVITINTTYHQTASDPWFEGSWSVSLSNGSGSNINCRRKWNTSSPGASSSHPWSNAAKNVWGAWSPLTSGVLNGDDYHCTDFFGVSSTCNPGGSNVNVTLDMQCYNTQNQSLTTVNLTPPKQLTFDLTP